MYLRVLPVAVLALALGGCVTAAVNTLHVDQIASLRLAGVNVAVAPDARIGWGDGGRAYAASKGVPADQSNTVANTPEARAYMRNTIGSKVKAAMERHLGGKLTGSRPVRVEVAVKEVTIPSVVQRVLVGGHHTMTADVTLVDARTGAVIIAYSGQRTAAMTGQGVAGVLVESVAAGDPVDRVVDNYAAQYSFWLRRMDERTP